MGVSDSSPQRSGVLYLYRQFWQLARGNRHKLIGACALLLSAQLIHIYLNSAVRLDEPSAHLDPKIEGELYARLFATFAGIAQTAPADIPAVAA